MLQLSTMYIKQPHKTCRVTTDPLPCLTIAPELLSSARFPKRTTRRVHAQKNSVPAREFQQYSRNICAHSRGIAGIAIAVRTSTVGGQLARLFGAGDVAAECRVT